MYSRRPQRLVSAMLHHRLSRLCLFQFSLQLSAVLPRRPSTPLIKPTHSLYASLTHTHTHTRYSTVPSSWRRWCWSGGQQWTWDLGDALGFQLGSYPGGRHREGKITWERTSCRKPLHMHTTHTHTHHIASLYLKTLKLITEQRPAIITKWLSV